MLRNLIVLAVACLIALGLAEGILRMFPGLLTEEAALRMHWNELGIARDQDGEAMVVADPEFGFRYLPNRTGTLSRGDFSFSFTTDAHGFRNAGPWPEEADIVVVGDSMAFGYGVEAEAAWAYRLDEALPEKSLINLGMIGTGPQQYLEVLRRHGLGLDPELVLFTVFPGNDLGDSEIFREWRDSDTDVGYRRWRVQGDSQEDAGSLIEEIWKGSYLIAVVRDARRSLSSPFAGETIEVADGSRLRLAPTTYVHSVRMAESGHPIFEHAMEVIARAQELVHEEGGRFVVLLVPTKEEVYLELRDRPHPALVDAFASALAERGIPYLDLTPALLEHASENGPLYFEVDGHPNNRGNEVIAEAVLDLVQNLDETFRAARRPLNHEAQNH